MSDKTEVTNAPKFSPEVAAAVAKIESTITLDSKTGQSSHPGDADDAYALTLPESLSIEHVKAVRKHDDVFVAATGHVHLSQSVAAMKSNSDLKETVATFSMVGGTKVVHKVDRERHFPDIRNPEGPGITVWGSLSSKITSTAGSNTGDLKKVRDWHKEAAMAALGGSSK